MKIQYKVYSVEWEELYTYSGEGSTEYPDIKEIQILRLLATSEEESKALNFIENVIDDYEELTILKTYVK